MAKIRVLIADDDAAARRGLRAMLSGASDDISVVEEAVDGEQALIMARVHRPEVVLMDLAMPGCDGIAATKRIKDEMPDCAVVILTIHPEDDYLFPALDAGACSYVLKDASAELVAEVVRLAAAGKGLLDSDVTRRVTDEFRRRYLARREARQTFSVLTRRERQVAVLIGRGLRNREIAAQIFVTEKTVKNHISGILSKLDCTRTQVAVLVTKYGLTESDL